MVFQLAVAPDQLSLFYGAVMQEIQRNQEPGVKKWTSKGLFGDGKLVLIEHENTLYRLMITKQGKLILNK